MQKVFTSKDDNQKIVYYHWDIENPIAIIHILHGSSEYYKRYNEFAKFLNRNHYSVIMMNITGHGETGKINGYGSFAKKDGYKYIWHDLHNINNM